MSIFHITLETVPRAELQIQSLTQSVNKQVSEEGIGYLGFSHENTPQMNTGWQPWGRRSMVLSLWWLHSQEPPAHYFAEDAVLKFVNMDELWGKQPAAGCELASDETEGELWLYCSLFPSCCLLSQNGWPPFEVPWVSFDVFGEVTAGPPGREHSDQNSGTIMLRIYRPTRYKIDSTQTYDSATRMFPVVKICTFDLPFPCKHHKITLVHDSLSFIDSHFSDDNQP